MTASLTNIVEIKSVNYIAQYKKLSDIIERYSSKLQLEEKEVLPLTQHPHFHEFMSASSGVVAIVDFKLQSYVYISDNTLEIMGYPKEDFMKLGMAKAIAIFPEDQNKTIIEKVFPMMFSFFEKHALIGDVNTLRISYNTKIRHANGTESWYLHQIRVLHTDENNLPHFGMKLITDITGIKKDDAIDFIVSKKNSMGQFEKTFATTFIVKNQKYHLSDRECEILQLAGDGNNTKTISETLFISEHTVNTHRKNILRKMEAKNITEGFRKAVSHGLI